MIIEIKKYIMKRMKLLVSILLMTVSMVMVSCDEIIHANMLEKTKWEYVQNGDFQCSDGNTYAGVKTIIFNLKKATEGELTATLVTSAETKSESSPFEYKFMDSMISGTITVKEGEYAGEYNVAYSHCDETLILYNSTAGVSMVLYEVTE